MDNLKKINIPRIYYITGLIALIYSGVLIALSVYNQFFYVDGTWLHGSIANGFSILTSLIWIGILLIFKRFLNKIFNYNKVNLLINAYVIFIVTTIIILATIIFKSIKFYLALQDTIDINSLPDYVYSSILGVLLLFGSNFAIILISILLGNYIRKIDIIKKELFKALGFSLIIYGICTFIVSVNIIENDTITYVLRAVLFALIGLILKNIYHSDSPVLYSSLDVEKVNKGHQSKPKSQEKVSPLIPSESKKKTNKKFIKNKVKQSDLEHKEIPNINIDALEDKETVLSYYENLSKEELNRLEFIVSKKYPQELTNEQKKNLVIKHIAENKMHDHQKYLPK